MAALLLAWLHHHPNDLKLAIEKATVGLQSVLIDTAAACGGQVLKAERTSEVRGLSSDDGMETMEIASEWQARRCKSDLILLQTSIAQDPVRPAQCEHMPIGYVPSPPFIRRLS